MEILKIERFARKPQKGPQKSKIAGKLELIGKKGLSFRYLWPLIEWNQLKYSLYQPTFFILLTSVINQLEWHHL